MFRRQPKEMTPAEYHDKIIAGVYETIFRVAGGRKTSVAGIEAVSGEVRPLTVIDALTAVIASTAVQSALYVTDEERLKLADKVRAQFLHYADDMEREIAKVAAQVPKWKPVDSDVLPA